MKQAQIITLAIAAVFGTGAVFLISKTRAKPESKPQLHAAPIASTKVLVTKKDIGLGEAVSATEAFRWVEWPQAAVTQSYITEAKRPNALKEFDKRIARAPMLSGEPVTESKLVKAGEGGVLSAILPPGMRAISTKINETTSVGRLILPNDFVDVILVQRKKGRTGEEHVSDVLFRNVRVLAIGQLIEAKEGKKDAVGNTATLELTPRQSELLALATSMGELTLALRSVADMNAAAGPGSGRESRMGNSIRVLRYGVRSRAYGVN